MHRISIKDEQKPIRVDAGGTASYMQRFLIKAKLRRRGKEHHRDFDTESKDAGKRKDVSTFSVSHSKHIHQPATDPRLIYRQGMGIKIKKINGVYPVMLTKPRPFLFDLTQFSTEGEDDDEEGGSVTLSGHYPIRQPGSPSI